VGGKTAAHHTRRPREARRAECAQLPPGTRSVLNPGKAPAEAAPAPPAAGKAAEGQASAKPRSMQGVPDKDPEKCKQAQDTKSVLDTKARIREKTETGEYRYLTPEENNEQRSLADESIGVFCDQ